jgi:methionyl aminopeptidase
MESNTTNQNEIVYLCNKTGCQNLAKLRCPECKKLQVKNESYFCGKDCFKAFWGEHKKVHEECK